MGGSLIEVYGLRCCITGVLIWVGIVVGTVIVRALVEREAARLRE